MNIFHLDTDAIEAANKIEKFGNWRHLVKMPLESVQMLSTAVRLLSNTTPGIIKLQYGKNSGNYEHYEFALPDEIGRGRAQLYYKVAYQNHPCTVWVRNNAENFQWLLKHTHRLFYHYRERFDKVHASYFPFNNCAIWFENNKNLFPNGNMPVPLAMPEQYKVKCHVQSYVNYYEAEKMP